MHRFFFDSEPVPWARARTCRGRFFTLPRVREYQRGLQAELRRFYTDLPIEGALRLELIFQVTKPKSVRRVYPHVKPDIDNLTKCVLDAFNGLLWIDDAQIVSLEAMKVYHERPGVHLTVKPFIGLIREV